MVVSNQTNRTSAVGAGAVLAIPYLFPTTASGDLTVIQRVISTGVETELEETTGYTATYSETGGTVTTVASIAATDQVHVIRNTPMTQTLDLEQGGSFNAENIENALDKNTKLIIENSDSLERTLIFPATDPTSSFDDMPNSVDRASKNLTFDSDGKPTASIVIEEGDVSFTDFGTDMAEAANADTARGLLELDTDDDVEFAEITGTTGTFTGAVSGTTGTFSGVISGTIGTFLYVSLTDLLTKGPWHDVRAYGATGDGTTDDSTAIQAAIDATPATGGVIYFPDGAYFFTKRTLTKPITFEGAHKESTFLQGDGDLIELGTAGNVTFRNLTIKNVTTRGKLIRVNPGADLGRCQFFNIDFDKANYHIYQESGHAIVDWYFERCRYNDAAVASRYLQSVTTFTENVCYTWYCKVGVQSEGALSTVRFLNSVFELNDEEAFLLNTPTGKENHGITFDNIHFETNGNVTPTNDVKLTGDAGTRHTGITFRNCTSWSPTDTTIVSISATPAVFDVVVDNCYGNGAKGFFVTDTGLRPVTRIGSSSTPGYLETSIRAQTVSNVARVLGTLSADDTTQYASGTIPVGTAYKVFVYFYDSADDTGYCYQEFFAARHSDGTVKVQLINEYKNEVWCVIAVNGGTDGFVINNGNGMTHTFQPVVIVQRI